MVRSNNMAERDDRFWHGLQFKADMLPLGESITTITITDC